MREFCYLELLLIMLTLVCHRVVYSVIDALCELLNLVKPMLMLHTAFPLMYAYRMLVLMGE